MLFQVARLPPQRCPLKTQCLTAQKHASNKTTSQCGTPAEEQVPNRTCLIGMLRAGLLKIDIPE
jgi:hypothetical protein